jgi:hypothetical protein
MPVFTDYPTTKQTSLNDLIGGISNIQNFQQQQQLMPLQLERAQLETQKARANVPLEISLKQLEELKARETNPSEIARLQSLSRQQLGTEPETISQQQEATKQAKTKTLSDVFAYDKDYNAQINQKLGGFLNDKGLKGSPSEVLRVLKDAENEVKLLTKSDPEHELKTEARFAPLKNLVVSGKHANVEQALKNIIQSGISPTSQQTLQTPQLTTLSGAPATFTPATGTAIPLTIGDQAPSPQYSQGEKQGGPLPPGMALPQGMPQGVTPTQMSLPYPIRKAGDIRPLAPNEAIDTEKGAAYRNNLTTRQTDLSTSRRNLDEVLKAATQIEKEDFFSSGVLGAVTRTLKGLAGDPKYKQLSKDLANVQIANIQAQGGSMDTVAGQQLQKMANGDETYPPEILKNIARRTYADIQNLDMQATGAAKFAQKYGDNNLNAFKRLWSQNADSKVFEAMTIFENVKDKDKRAEEIDKILGEKPKLDNYKNKFDYEKAFQSYTNQREKFYNKYNNIKKLTETGEL